MRQKANQTKGIHANFFQFESPVNASFEGKEFTELLTLEDMDHSFIKDTLGCPYTQSSHLYTDSVEKTH